MKQIILLLALISLTGCVKIIDDDFSAKDPKLVLNAALSTDSSLTINLSRTYNIFDNESDKNLPFIDGAEIGLFENGNWIFDLENPGYGYYVKPGFYPETGTEYRIEATSKGFAGIESKTTIPSPVQITEFDTVVLVIMDEFYGDEIRYIGYLTYKDPAGTSNSYRLRCKMWIKNDDGEIIRMDQYLWVFDNDYYFYDNANGNLLWNDKYSDGKEVEIRFVYYSNNFYKSVKPDEQDTLTFVFSFETLNQEYYTYLKSLNRYYESGGGDNPFSEPVVIYSNIENGYGIFGGFGRDTVSTKIILDNNRKGGGE